MSAANLCKVGALKLMLVDGGAQTSGQNELGDTSNHLSMDGNDENGGILEIVVILMRLMIMTMHSPENGCVMEITHLKCSYGMYFHKHES